MGCAISPVPADNQELLVPAGRELGARASGFSSLLPPKGIFLSVSSALLPVQADGELFQSFNGGRKNGLFTKKSVKNWFCS